MKIALTCPASLPATQFGGIMFLCVHVAKKLSNEGHDLTIYTTDLDFANTTKFNKKLPKEEKIDNFIIKRTHVWMSSFLFFFNPGMYRQMMNDNYDVIHTVGIRSFQAFISAIVSKRKKIPLIISTGASNIKDIFLACEAVRSYHNNFSILHTVSIYPANNHQLNLRMIKSCFLTSQSVL